MITWIVNDLCSQSTSKNDPRNRSSSLLNNPKELSLCLSKPFTVFCFAYVWFNHSLCVIRLVGWLKRCELSQQLDYRGYGIPNRVRHGTLTGTVEDTPCPESDPCFTCLCVACKPESQTGTTSLNFLLVHTTSAEASLSGHFNFGMPNWQVVGLGPRGSQNMWSIITRCTLLVRSLQHAMCAFHVIALCAQRILQVRYHMTQQTRVIRARPSRCL